MGADALGVLACVEALGLNVEEVAAYLASCWLPKGRGTRLSGHYRHRAITLIDDSYVLAASMTAAFESMAAMPPTIMILSDMRELGTSTALEHNALMPQINALSPRLVIALGPAMHDAIHRLDDHILSIAAADINTAFKIFNTAIKDGDVVFIGIARVRVMASSRCLLLDLAVYPSSDAPSTMGGTAMLLTY